jgi:TP53 regulating kinase and related kinases
MKSVKYMKNNEVLVQGAEAKIILNNDFIIKDRIKKSYRIMELDDKIRKSRTKKEAKLLEKASQIINAPKPLPTKEIYQIKMPYIKGQKLSESLDSFPLEKQKEICKKI